MNDKRVQLFHMKKSNDTPLLRIHFHVRCCFARLISNKVKRFFFKMGYWWKGSNSTALPATSAFEIMDQHSEIGGIIFKATLIHPLLNSSKLILNKSMVKFPLEWTHFYTIFYTNKCKVNKTVSLLIL